MSISTHILDIAAGRPAANIAVSLLRFENEAWNVLSHTRTDGDGRVRYLLPTDIQLTPGVYRIAFVTADYYTGQGVETLYPVVEITFTVREGQSHYHVPLLLSANGFTTYRGT